MLRSTLAVAFSLVLVVACAKTSDNPPVVTAPVASAGAPATTDSAAAAPSALAGGTTPEGGTPLSAAPDTTGAGSVATFQACQSDSDCVAVRRVGCCYNGDQEAVNVGQQDAYAASFTCPRRHPCPMYIKRDTRVPKCDPGTHLCQMVNP